MAIFAVVARAPVRRVLMSGCLATAYGPVDFTTVTCPPEPPSAPWTASHEVAAGTGVTIAAAGVRPGRLRVASLPDRPDDVESADRVAGAYDAAPEPAGHPAIAGERSAPPGFPDRLVRGGRIPACPPEPLILLRTDRPVVVYPNPVPDDSVRIALDLAEDAVRVDLEMFNGALQRVRRGSWSNVTRAEGGVVMDGMLRLQPGVYLLRVIATFADGDDQRFPPVRLIVKRAAK